MTFSAVNWQDSTKENITISGGQVTGTGTTSSFTGNVRSTYTIASPDSIQFTYDNNDSSNRVVAGIGKDPFSGSGATISEVEYAWFYSTANSSWRVYENGTEKYSTTGVAGSATAKITRAGTAIQYYLNGSLKYTSTVTTSDPLYAHAATIGTGSITMETDSSQTSTGGGTTIEGEAALIEHILYLNTVVPR